MTDDPRARAIEAMQARRDGAYWAGLSYSSPIDDRLIEELLDAIPGDVHAHLAQRKGAECPCADCDLTIGHEETPPADDPDAATGQVVQPGAARPPGAT